MKELIFSDSAVNVKEITGLIDAKGIELKENFPYTTTQVLTLTQESFMQDKYLPLNRRKELIKELEDLKTLLPKPTPDTKENKSEDFWTNLSWGAIASILASILTGLLGTISIFRRQKKEEETQEELKNEIEKSEISYTESSKFAYELENALLTILKEDRNIKFIESADERDNGYDAHFQYNGKDYFVEFKFLTRSKVGLSTIRQIMYSVRDKKGEVWLVYNTELTTMVKNEIREISKSFPNIMFRAIHVKNIESFKRQVDELLHTT